MFPDRITAGYILTVAGNAYVVMSRTPDDAFVARSLDVASIVETFSFEELLEAYEEGMLRIEPPRSAERDSDEREALWAVVCQELERILADNSASLSDASLKAVIPKLALAQARHLGVDSGGSSPDRCVTLLRLSPYMLRKRLHRYRTHGAGSGLATMRPARDRLASFDPVVAEMTWAVATMYVRPDRPTIRELYRELECRLAFLPERHTLQIPSLSTFQRLVSSLPRDLVDTARHGLARAAFPRDEAA